MIITAPTTRITPTTTSMAMAAICQPCRPPPDQELLGPGHLAAGDHGHDGQDQHDGKPDQVGFAGVQHGDYVFNVDGKHSILPPVVFLGRTHTEQPFPNLRGVYHNLTSFFHERHKLLSFGRKL